MSMRPVPMGSRSALTDVDISRARRLYQMVPAAFFVYLRVCMISSCRRWPRLSVSVFRPALSMASWRQGRENREYLQLS